MAHFHSCQVAACVAVFEMASVVAYEVALALQQALAFAVRPVAASFEVQQAVVAVVADLRIAFAVTEHLDPLRRGPRMPCRQDQGTYAFRRSDQSEGLVV